MLKYTLSMPAINARSRSIFLAVTLGSLHRQPLIGGRRLGNEGVHAADDATDLAAGRAYFTIRSRSCNVRSRIAHQVVVSFRREADHVIQLQVFDAGRKDQLRPGSRISSFVTVLLITRRSRSDPVSGAMVIVRSPLFAQQPHDRLGQIVKAQRTPD